MTVFHASPKSRIVTFRPLSHFGGREAAVNRGAFYLREKRRTFLYVCEAIFANSLRIADYGLDMGSALRLADALYYDERQITAGERESVLRVSARPQDAAKQLAAILLAKGYDSIVYQNRFEGGGDSWSILKPDQVRIITIEPLTPEPLGVSWQGDEGWSRRYVCQNCGHSGRCSKELRGPEIVCPICSTSTPGRRLESILAGGEN